MQQGTVPKKIKITEDCLYLNVYVPEVRNFQKTICYLIFKILQKYITEAPYLWGLQYR